MKYDLLEITWVDSGQQMASSWTPKDLVIERAKELDTTVTTIGYAIHSDPEFVLLAQSIDQESGAVAGVMRVEFRSVTKARKLGDQ